VNQCLIKGDIQNHILIINLRPKFNSHSKLIGPFPFLRSDKVLNHFSVFVLFFSDIFVLSDSNNADVLLRDLNLRGVRLFNDYFEHEVDGFFSLINFLLILVSNIIGVQNTLLSLGLTSLMFFMHQVNINSFFVLTVFKLDGLMLG